MPNKGRAHYAPKPPAAEELSDADQDTRLSIPAAIPVLSAVTVIGNVQRVINCSNSSNFEYDNTIGSLGTSARF